MKNKNLEKLFNLNAEAEEENTNRENKNSLINVKKDNESEQKLDEIINIALMNYKEMIDLGYQTDPKYASNFLEPAVSLINSIITAEKIKIDKRLENKKISIQEKKIKLLQKKLELERRKMNGMGMEMVENEEGIFVDRNELLKKLLNKE
jgi:hypothetical protein